MKNLKPVSEPRFGSGTSKIQIRSDNHSFGHIYHIRLYVIDIIKQVELKYISSSTWQKTTLFINIVEITWINKYYIYTHPWDWPSSLMTFVVFLRSSRQMTEVMTTSFHILSNSSSPYHPALSLTASLKTANKQETHNEIQATADTHNRPHSCIVEVRIRLGTVILTENFAFIAEDSI